MSQIDRETLHHYVDRTNFVVRCAASATLAWYAAVLLQSPHPVWASMSALIVSQETVHATRSSVSGRVAGTLIGALVALAVNVAGDHWQLAVPLQLAAAVGICAIIAMGRPAIRVCLWTCPLVLLTTTSTESPFLTAVYRTAEVLIGVIIGGLLHLAEASLMTWLRLGRYRLAEEQPELPGRLLEAHLRGVAQHKKDVENMLHQGND
ncbi:putative membrane protein YccC [Silvimonas terrae]|uniref:Putative membrane protein YccC n=1 Tax=Silvimonas terrae TaxID=300266 RepID=A0A840RIA5_9NEIS|nr:FUSC family protein [Silvimonas terrae]MBB5192314.1 putative membrane protein YccC [Silvimonas terrae]